jgi:hypothetical protein
MIIVRALLFLAFRPEIIRRKPGENKREPDETLAQIEDQLVDHDGQTAEAEKKRDQGR